jgi:hypothetical protein
MAQLAPPREAADRIIHAVLNFTILYVQNITKQAAQSDVAFGVATFFKKVCSSLAFP